MATFFGEIVESSSRAFLDDDEDDYDDDSAVSTENIFKYAVSLQSEVTSLTACGTFLVVSGSVAIAFFERFLLNGKTAAGTIKRSQPNSDDNKKPLRKQGEGTIYLLPGEITACVVSSVLDTEAIPFVDCLADIMRSATSQVLVLTSSPLNQFRSLDPLPADTEGFLRSLATENPPPPELSVSCPPLEIPNLVVGVSAAVVTWCQLEKIKSRLVICYSEESCGMIDSRTMDPLMPLLRCPPLNALYQKADQKSQLPVAHQVSGNMYV